jgi:hypothetical protein
MRGPLKIECRALYRAHHIYLAAVQLLAYRALNTQQLLAFTVEDDLVILSWLRMAASPSAAPTPTGECWRSGATSHSSPAGGMRLAAFF